MTTGQGPRPTAMARRRLHARRRPVISVSLLTGGLLVPSAMAPGVPWGIAASDALPPSATCLASLAQPQQASALAPGAASAAAPAATGGPELPPREANVEGFFYGEWYAAVVRQHIRRDDGTWAIQVLWEDEHTTTDLELEHVRPRSPVVPPPSAAPYMPASAPAAPYMPTSAQYMPPQPAAPLPSAPVLLPLALASAPAPIWTLEDVQKEDNITSSTGYLTLEGASNHPFICHMCKKKLMAFDMVVDHVATRKHQRKRSHTEYSLDDWVRYNLESGFYCFEC